MPTPGASITWLGSLTWLLAILAAGFLVTWVLTDLLGLRRTPYLLPLALLTRASPGATWPGATRAWPTS
jgi:hypothetical protein